jgi:hypothetical protein
VKTVPIPVIAPISISSCLIGRAGRLFRSVAELPFVLQSVSREDPRHLAAVLVGKLPLDSDIQKATAAFDQAQAVEEGFQRDFSRVDFTNR